ncbi:MAG: DUF2851 family protein [Muribaculaceae bacterium]|nr:DUF2851 family protein [Muribaculaceae bacterium]
MDEALLQCVWQMRLYSPGPLTTIDGTAVEVLHPGLKNIASGPDFANARVKIGNTLWAGDVEIHLKASDWHRHGHQNDRAYDKIILHVVANSDTSIARHDGSAIPQIVITPDARLISKYHDLINRADIDVACQDSLRTLPPIVVSDWINALAMQRIQAKALRVNDLLAASNGDWEEAAYVTLARALGFGTNADPMERLAKSLPLKIIRKHSDTLLSIEALLFGQAGLLNEDKIRAHHPYFDTLATEYAFLAKKFSLRPSSLPLKTGGMRPTSSPHRRIALLASIIYNNTSLCSSLANITDIDAARNLFATPLTGWWKDNYTFNHSDKQRAAGEVSESTLQLLIINSVVPFTTAYGMNHGDSQALAAAVDTLENLPAERNRIVSAFTYCGIRCPDALTSQALIHLRREYCEKRKCLDCRFGFRHLSSLKHSAL